MEGILRLSEEGVVFGPLAVNTTFALTFRAPVAALQYQAGTGLELMAEGAAETEFAPPVALHHKLRKALAAPESGSTFHIFQLQFILQFALVILAKRGGLLRILPVPETQRGNGRFHQHLYQMCPGEAGQDPAGHHWR